jgi:hypothetical protein
MHAAVSRLRSNVGYSDHGPKVADEEQDVRHQARRHAPKRTCASSSWSSSLRCVGVSRARWIVARLGRSRAAKVWRAFKIFVFAVFFSSLVFARAQIFYDKITARIESMVKMPVRTKKKRKRRERASCVCARASVRSPLFALTRARSFSNRQPALDEQFVDAAEVAQKVIAGVFPGVKTTELDTLAAETVRPLRADRAECHALVMFASFVCVRVCARVCLSASRLPI